MKRQTRSILVASDLTPASDEVLRGAADLARASGAKLHVIHALDEAMAPYTGAGGSVLDMQSRVHEARLALVDQVGRTGSEGLVASARLGSEAPYRAILQRAREVDADLLVIGPHRGPTVGSRILGTTADRVVRTAEVAVLILRGALNLPLRKVLVPTDFSAQAKVAMDESVAWAEAFGTDESQGDPTVVRAVHVVPKIIADMALDAPGRRWIVERLTKQASEVRANRSEGSRVEVREEVIGKSAPAPHIVKLAEEDEVDLVVLGTHGRGMFERALVGSVASAVARQVTRPVLLVPPALSSATPRPEPAVETDGSPELIPLEL